MDIKIYKNRTSGFAELRFTKRVQNCDKIHTHDYLTIATIEHGSQKIFVNKKNIKHGTIAVINPNEPHYGKVTEDNTSNGYVLYLQKDWCEKLQFDLFENINSYLPIENNIIENSELFGKFINSSKLLLSNISSIEKDEILIEFVSDLFLKYCKNSLPQKNHIKYNGIEQANAIKKYLDEHFIEDISISQIAAFVNLSHYYLIRIFKNQFGMSPYSYLINKRVHKAKELLMKNESIADIALESGFYDQSHLNREFKKVFSITPREYQKNIIV